MSRIARIAFLAAAIVALTAVAGLDLRLALATRDPSVETSAALDQHERHPNGMSVVTDQGLDAHERSAIADARAAASAPLLDESERRAKAAGLLPSIPAALDEHERPAWREREAGSR
jgi:hypothetical protein